MKETGFIQQKAFQIKFSDLPELFFSGIILRKMEDQELDTPIFVEISLLDLFPQYKTLNEIETLLLNKHATIVNRMTGIAAAAAGLLSGINLEPERKEVNLLSFFNNYLERKLHFLKNGDSTGLIPCIEDYKVDNANGLNNYVVEVIPSKFIRTYPKQVFEFIRSNEKTYAMFKDISTNIGWGLSYRKQIEFYIDYLNNRTEATGETVFDFDLKEIQFIHALVSVEEGDKRLTLPAPLTLTADERVLLPLYLETVGVFDLNSFKINTKIEEIENIGLTFSVTCPAIRNRFLAKAYGLDPDKRKSFSESQIHIYEKVFRTLFEGGGFVGRPNIEENFCKIFYWLLKKVTYCIEEPSFLKEKSEAWLKAKGNGNYVQMEDDFFLPFIHEKLKDEFGDLVTKKPEKFGGEVDILFSELPIELKVRKNKTESLNEIIDDYFKPASQAATYAAVTRLGFVLVLDIPQSQTAMTNLDSCFKIIEKEFSPDALKTQIVVCIFHCNLPKPSAAH